MENYKVVTWRMEMLRDGDIIAHFVQLILS